MADQNDNLLVKINWGYVAFLLFVAILWFFVGFAVWDVAGPIFRWGAVIPWAMGLFVVVGMVWEIREMMAKRHDLE